MGRGLPKTGVSGVNVVVSHNEDTSKPVDKRILIPIEGLGGGSLRFLSRPIET